MVLLKPICGISIKFESKAARIPEQEKRLVYAKRRKPPPHATESRFPCLT
jgi:hypothetical protein